MNPDEAEELYLATAKLVEFAIDKKLTSIINSMTPEDMSEINKFFFTTYERIDAKKEVFTLKSAKAFPAHQELINAGSIGLMHRGMFSTKKGNKKETE